MLFQATVQYSSYIKEFIIPAISKRKIFLLYHHGNLNVIEPDATNVYDMNMWETVIALGHSDPNSWVCSYKCGRTRYIVCPGISTRCSPLLREQSWSRSPTVTEGASKWVPACVWFYAALCQQYHGGAPQQWASDIVPIWRHLYQTTHLHRASGSIYMLVYSYHGSL